MIRYVADRVWAFDAEWIPDPLAGRLLYDVPDSVTDSEEIMKLMWQRGGATPEDATPFLKLAVCRVVSIAAGRKARHRHLCDTTTAVPAARTVVRRRVCGDSHRPHFPRRCGRVPTTARGLQLDRLGPQAALAARHDPGFTLASLLRAAGAPLGRRRLLRSQQQVERGPDADPERLQQRDALLARARDPVRNPR